MATYFVSYKVYRTDENGNANLLNPTAVGTTFMNLSNRSATSITTILAKVRKGTKESLIPENDFIHLIAFNRV